jgi:hypothetical protein
MEGFQSAKPRRPKQRQEPGNAGLTDRPPGARTFRNRKFVDSPLEGDGFELPVPRDLTIKFIDRPTRHRRFKPIEKLRGRIDLIVVLAFRENHHLVEVFGEPRGGFREVNEAILDQPGLRMQPHDLVAFRLCIS